MVNKNSNNKPGTPDVAERAQKENYSGPEQLDQFTDLATKKDGTTIDRNLTRNETERTRQGFNHNPSQEKPDVEKIPLV